MWKHRLGYLPRLARCIWIHAESLGELKSTTTLIQSLHAMYPTLDLMITVQTQTGFNYGTQNLSYIAHIAYAPFDLPCWTKRTINRINPVILLSIENAIWPNRFSACARKKIPVVLVNAKMGLRTYDFYRQFPRIARWLFKNISHVFAASPEQTKRFSTLGVQNVRTVGELKLTSERWSLLCHRMQNNNF